jgi:hypothetical protein
MCHNKVSNQLEDNMKLITKEIQAMLHKQYPIGANMENQKVVCKFFHPFSNWKWYIMNQDPEDETYLWGIVKGFEIETGSIYLPELIELRIHGLPIERDLHFRPTPAIEIWERLHKGEYI